jgi:osmotically-inducible protein OsmY
VAVAAFVLTTGAPALVADVEAPASANTNSAGRPQGIVVHGNEETVAQAQVDQQIAREISQRMESDRLVPSYKVEVSVADRVVTLRGIVDTLMARERALQLAQVQPGIKAVRNEVTVAAPQREDPEIVVEVQKALRADPALRNSNLKVTSESRNVTVTGTVNSKHRKALAELLAKGVKGVVEVENEIRFVAQPSRSDEDIAADVRSRIQWDPWLNNPRLAVVVDRGVVKVTGQVPSTDAKKRIQEDAMAPGVASVDLSSLQVVDDIAGVEGPLEKLSPTGRTDSE